MGFGTVNEKVRLRIAFPETFVERDADEDGDKSGICYPSEDFKAFFHNSILRPSIFEIQPEIGLHWPTSYEHRQFTSRGEHGQYIYNQKGVARSCAHRLMSVMHRRVRGLQDQHHLAGLMVGFVIYWETQDIKLNTQFIAPPQSRNVWRTPQGKEALDGALAEIDQSLLVKDNVYIDAAVEFSLPGKSLYWSPRGHAAVLEEILGYTASDARDLLSTTGGRAEYQRDLLCSLSGLAGFHLNRRGKKTPKGLLYAQAYHTDKEIAYQASSTNKIVPLDPASLLQVRDAHGKSYFVNWITSCIRALQEQVEQQTSAAARWEVTIPLSKLGNTDMHFSPELLRATLVAVRVKSIP